MSVEHRADDELYRAAETLFGTNALMDIAVLVGTYHMAYATPTTFAIPAPGLDGARGLVAVQTLWAPRTCSLGAASAHITDTFVSPIVPSITYTAESIRTEDVG